MIRLKAVLIIILFGTTLISNAQDINAVGEKFNEGIQFTKEKNYPSAIEAYQATIDMASQLGEEGAELKGKAEQAIASSYYNYGVSLYKSKDYTNAIKNFKIASEKSTAIGDQKTADASSTYIAGLYVGIGNSKFKKDDFENAIKDYKTALQYKPDYIKAYYSMGLVYKKQEDYDQMQQAFDKVLEMGAENDKTVVKTKDVAATTFLNAGAIDLQRMNYDEAIRHLELSTTYNPAESQAYYYMAVAYNGMKKWDEAIAACNMARDKGYDVESDIFFQIGQASEGKGDSSAACEAYAQVTDGPNVDAAKYQMSQVLGCN
jgi:tetratricopeptide (TPR) repeat protein